MDTNLDKVSKSVVELMNLYPGIQYSDAVEMVRMAMIYDISDAWLSALKANERE